MGTSNYENESDLGSDCNLYKEFIK